MPSMGNIIIYILIFSIIPLVFAADSYRNKKEATEHMKKDNAAKPENTSASDTHGKTKSDNNVKSPCTDVNLRPGIVGSQPDRKASRNPSPDYDMPSMMRPWDEAYRTGGDEEELRW